jgi:diguanylate cyclase (GGDEF)-like protein
MSVKILVVEDTKVVREQIRDVLLKGRLAQEVIEATDGLNGFKLLLKHRPDLVICDITMPQLDGFKFLEMRSGRNELSDIPVLMLTASGDVENKVKALERGAVDYITKPFNDSELIARVKVHLQIKSLQDELRHANVLLEKLAVTDGLTSIYNRRYLMDALEKEFQRAKRYGESFAVILIDVDHFKGVNDNFGHQMGDFVLRELAQILFQQLRGTDTVGRYGGEEFVILLPGTDLQGAASLADRIRYLVEQHPFRRGDAFARITLSAGVVAYPHPLLQSMDDVVQQADAALYRAKEQGRNVVQVMNSA